MKKEKIGKRTKAYRMVTHLTVSFPEDLAKELRKEKNYSALLASLYRAYKEQATPSTPTVTDEEAAIRNALKDREKLMALHGNLVYDVEWVIRKGEDDNYVPIKDWRAYMKEKGVTDPNGYFEMYEKHEGQHAEDKLYDLWHDVQGKVKEEQEKEHEARLKHEVVPGMTLQDAIDKLKAYRQQKLDRKVQEKTAEIDAIKDDHTGAGPYMRRQQIREEINELTKRFEENEVSYSTIMNALGLSYQEVYNKVAAALRLEGYKVVAGRRA